MLQSRESRWRFPFTLQTITDFQDAGDLGRVQDLGGQFDQSPLISVQHSGKLKLFTFASFQLFIRYKLSTIMI